jgi:phosphotriesterase-related protein
MIPTVLGQIEPEEMGITLPHEHIACFSHDMRQAFGDRWIDMDAVIAEAVRLLAKARDECGIATIIDGTPNNLGRDIQMLRAVSELSGVEIIASSGMYHQEPPYVDKKSPETLSGFFIHECLNGIRGTGVRPGMLKCATGPRGCTPVNTKLLQAMAITQKATGLPLFAHNTHAIHSALKQTEILESSGADLHKVIVGHCSDTEDIQYLESLLRRGCYLGFDRIKNNDKDTPAQARTLCALISRGWIDRLLLSHDAWVFVDFSIEEDWASLKRRLAEGSIGGYTYIHDEFLPLLKTHGITDKQIRRITVENPANMCDPSLHPSQGKRSRMNMPVTPDSKGRRLTRVQ